VCLPIVEPLPVVRQRLHTCTAHEMAGRPCAETFLPPSLHSTSDDDAVGRALFDFSSANLAQLSQGVQQRSVGLPTVPTAVEEAFLTDEQFLTGLRTEMRLQMEALRAQQLAAASQSPVQIVVENCAATSVDQREQHGELCRVVEDSTERWWRDFVISPANRIVVFTMVQLSLYFAHGYLNHRYRVAEVQQRIDANALLRFQQILSSFIKDL